MLNDICECEITKEQCVLPMTGMSASELANALTQGAPSNGKGHIVIQDISELKAEYERLSQLSRLTKKYMLISCCREEGIKTELFGTSDEAEAAMSEAYHAALSCDDNNITGDSHALCGTEAHVHKHSADNSTDVYAWKIVEVYA